MELMTDNKVILVINCELTSGADADTCWDYCSVLVTFQIFNFKGVWSVLMYQTWLILLRTISVVWARISGTENISP